MNARSRSEHNSTRVASTRRPHRIEAVASASSIPPVTTSGTTLSRLKAYKSTTSNKWVTREIAALEFLLEIPMGAEADILREGALQVQGTIDDGPGKDPSGLEEVRAEILEPPNGENLNDATTTSLLPPTHQGRFWEGWINNPNSKKTKRMAEDSEFEHLQTQPTYANGGTGRADVSHTSKGMQTEEVRQQVLAVGHAPGRRLEGDEAIRVQIPLSVDTSITRQRSVARMAFTREWEIQVAHGIGVPSSSSRVFAPKSNVPANMTKTVDSFAGSSGKPHQLRPPMLEGRLFFSSASSYPLHVFSLLRYEPKKEEAARRRQKLEARGGGGTQFFVMPARDWRGISYRVLLPPRRLSSQIQKQNPATLRFDRFTSRRGPARRFPDEIRLTDHEKPDHSDDDDDDDYRADEGDEEEEEEDPYVTGLLDDPDMVQGRHRNVMIGDRVTGCIVSSTIQFVKPALLKADLNKQFRERFEGWEPPKSQRQYIGARVIDGVYTLLEPGTVDPNESKGDDPGEDGDATIAPGSASNGKNILGTQRIRQGSVSSLPTGTETKEVIRMPPSLTLSKIRSLKRQALLAAVQAKLEMSTVALAIVYFERLCLDCRVDKTNRRLSFAACLLLAIKINEAHVGLVTRTEEDLSLKSTTTNRIQALIRPTKKSNSMFASLLEFFTQDWNISIKHLFAAEWGVFAALQFRLHAKPSQVAFHFKRLLKSLDWYPLRYLGAEMYSQWQQALSREEFLRKDRETRREARQKREEQQKLIQLHRELEASTRRDRIKDVVLPSGEAAQNSGGVHLIIGSKSLDRSPRQATAASPKRTNRQASRIGGIFNRFSGVKRVVSTDKIPFQHHGGEGITTSKSSLSGSPSMPVLPTTQSRLELAEDPFASTPEEIDNSPANTIHDDQSVSLSDGGAIMI